MFSFSGSGQSLGKWGFVGAGVVAIVVAFLWGNYLLGFKGGAYYLFGASGLVYLFHRARKADGRVSIVRAVFVVPFAVLAAFVMAFPAYLNPDIRYAIEKQATDRQARAELAVVFASDPAFRDLSISSVNLKVVNVSVQGSLSNRAELDRLRFRMIMECPALEHCSLDWDVTLRGSGQRVKGSDEKFF